MNSQQNGGPQPGGGIAYAPPPKQDMEYLCAGQLLCQLGPAPQLLILCADCGAKNEIKSREPIRCRECGHRIMYKKRTKRSTWKSSLLGAGSMTNHLCTQWSNLRHDDLRICCESKFAPSHLLLAIVLVPLVALDNGRGSSLSSAIAPMRMCTLSIITGDYHRHNTSTCIQAHACYLGLPSASLPDIEPLHP